ncbi:hypothetical protein Anas_14452 [Armadillidium nasatum]|uniref:Uncharacterized protein n=1 Tax=Armadillidium nasatum TaxID=96803 RepID=A0A5N5T357_9CRUS|nr:hypothetical protein Anas_14452 [Armadillidium nasatum]
MINAIKTQSVLSLITRIMMEMLSIMIRGNKNKLETVSVPLKYFNSAGIPFKVISRKSLWKRGVVATPPAHKRDPWSEMGPKRPKGVYKNPDPNYWRTYN